MSPVLPTKAEVSAEALRLHEEASRRGEDTYIDPQSGRIVFTRAYHLLRGYCCSSGCRHCPYRDDTAPK